MAITVGGGSDPGSGNPERITLLFRPRDTPEAAPEMFGEPGSGATRNGWCGMWMHTVDSMWEALMRKVLIAPLFAACLAVATPTQAWALVTPTTGQPGAPVNTCGPDNPVTPGAAANAPGSPFNASGQAGVVYAGNPGTASLAHANSSAAVSQYDTACVQLSH